MTSGKKSLLVIVALAVLVGVPLAMNMKKGNAAKEVEVETVAERIISPTILASGSLTYQTEIRIMSEVMGRVKELYVKEGQQVAKGDLLLRLDPTGGAHCPRRLPRQVLDWHG
jgi:HlyD family secretion protein